MCFALGTKSKPGENFLSLQCKDSTPYPLPPPYLYIVKIENFHPILTPSLISLKFYQSHIKFKRKESFSNVSKCPDHFTHDIIITISFPV